MGSLLDLVRQLRQGIWSSITGGWYYDPYHKVLTNTVHLYLWLIFLCLPFSVHLYFPPGSWFTWIYNAVIFLIFLVVKSFNRTLHNLFDTGDVHEVTETGVGEDIGQANEENIELQDMSGGRNGADGVRVGTPDPRRTSFQELLDPRRTSFHDPPAREGGSDLQTASRFDLKVDVHSKPGGPSLDDLDGARPWALPRPDEVIDIDKDKGEVVILVDGGSNHTAHSQTVLEETKNLGVSFDASQVEGSFSTTSSQITMTGVAGRAESSRRYSNISNLARSIRREPGAAGSLEILAILDPNLSQLGNRRRMNQTKPGRNVRRTKSVLDTGLGCVAPMAVSSYPVSLDAGMNSEFRHQRSHKPPSHTLRTMELKEFQISEASEEGSFKEVDTFSSKQDENVKQVEEEPIYISMTRKRKPSSESSGSGVYENIQEELDSKPDATSNNEYSQKLDPSETSPSERSGPGTFVRSPPVDNGTSVRSPPVDNGTSVRSPPVDNGSEALNQEDSVSRINRGNTPQKSRETTPRRGLGSLGVDWLFSDTEPEEPPNSPKQVPPLSCEDRGGARNGGELVVRLVGADQTLVKSRDSSHGSSGTDTETRTLLNKLDEVEASLEACGGAIPKRRPRGNGRRPSKRGDEELRGEYELPESSSLYEDAAGLKLFLDILSGPDSHNPQAEVELRKLIQKKRSRIGSDGNIQNERRVRRRLAARRKRRHAAEPQTEDQFPPTELRLTDDQFAPTTDHLAPTAEDGEESLQSRRRRRREKEREARETHLAENHEDTSTGAVHCFQDEYGNWQTYTFGGETETSVAVLGLAARNRNSRQFSVDSSGSRRPSRPTEDEKQPVPEGYQPAAVHFQNIGGGGEDSVGTDPTSPYSQSQSSSDSGLTVILDSPAMVFQPTVDRQRSRDSAAESGWAPSAASAASGRERDSVFWSRENSNSGRYNVAASSQAFRRYNPLSMFAENLFDRLPGGATNNAAHLEMTPYTPEGSSQLTRLEEGSVGVNISTQSAHQGSIHSATPKIRKYHLLNFPGTQGVKIWLDRLQLLNILDQDPSITHTFVAVLLGTATAILGSQVIQEGYYQDLWLVLFCLVLCSSQYSLIKSVQPDASSPTHGFNTITVYSRPVYFIILCSVVLILEAVLKGEVVAFPLYGVVWGERAHLVVLRDTVYGLLLAFPLIFTLGLLPQINTAAMFLLEQTDIQIFGGNAASSIQSSFYCVVRSILSVGVLVGFAYGGLTERTHSAHAQQVLFSIFCSLAVPLSYHLSRSSGDPGVLLSILKRHILAIISEDVPDSSRDLGLVSPDPPSTPEDDPSAPQDPLPKKLRDTVNLRLKNDLILSVFSAVLVFLVVQSDVLEKTRPYTDIVLWILALVAGALLHYILPHLRKENPWKCIAAPVLKAHEHGQFEVRQPARVMWWEKFQLWAVTLEKSALYPLIFLSTVYQDKGVFSNLFGLWGGSLLMSICLLKCLRICFSDCSKQYIILLLAVLIFQYNPTNSSINYLVVGEARRSPFLLDYFLTSILINKLLELYLKCQFVITYTAPHQINWGSAFHAFAQPFSVPHSAMLFAQAAVSSLLSAPLNPFLGSTIFLCSYCRPVKFWERNYNTKRVDNSNTRLSSQVLEMRTPGADDNNLNSIFYEHLTRSLQHSLAGDIMLGRWGEVQQGDFFVLASDYLNCLVHIIELGNGLCTFQVRGLEFRGTYCHQREVEAISEGLEDDEGCCCCEPGHLPHILSLNAALSQRWLAWEVSAVKYVLEGYSISDNSAQSMLQVYDLRKILVSYYIKSIVYYTVRSPKLQDWLANPSIRDAIRATASKNFVDLDPLFNSNIDEDFDFRACGITRNSFCNIYLPWIQHCAKARDRSIAAGKDSELVSLCLALSVLGRRALGAAGPNFLTTVEFFLVGLHSLFKGDFRITSVRDEWVFSDMELLRKVVAPGVRMSLKLHQDHFMSPDEYEDPSVLYEAISGHEKDLVISHEGDPAWRTAVLSGAPSLLALRHVVDDGSDEYKIIMLNKRFLSFRVIKLNRECVRGLWAGQQQELIFLRNRNPERGSIQNAKQALRNIINSSCDQPLGYPIYVSPLTTSYSDTNSQVCGVLGGPLSLGVFKTALLHCWSRLHDRCIGSCSSGSAGVECDINIAGDGTQLEHLRGGSLPGNRSSVVSSVSKPSSGTLVSLAGLLGSQSLPVGTLPPSAFSSLVSPPPGEKDPPPLSVFDETSDLLTNLGAIKGTPSIRPKKRSVAQYPVVRILDPLMVYDNINLGRRIDPVWPQPEWRAKGGRNSWNNWIPMEDMKGYVLHRWTPLHPNPTYRSHTDKTILLVKIEDKYVPIAEHAVELVYQDRDGVEARSSRDSPSTYSRDPPSTYTRDSLSTHNRDSPSTHTRDSPSTHLKPTLVSALLTRRSDQGRKPDSLNPEGSIPVPADYSRLSDLLTPSTPSENSSSSSAEVMSSNRFYPPTNCSSREEVSATDRLDPLANCSSKVEVMTSDLCAPSSLPQVATAHKHDSKRRRRSLGATEASEVDRRRMSEPRGISVFTDSRVMSDNVSVTDTPTVAPSPPRPIPTGAPPSPREVPTGAPGAVPTGSPFPPGAVPTGATPPPGAVTTTGAPPPSGAVPTGAPPPPGAVPTGAPPPPRVVPTGAPPKGAVPTGAPPPPGAVPTGASPPPGAVPSGAPPTGASPPPGAVPTGAPPPGAVPTGAPPPPGAVPTGAPPPGAVPTGATPPPAKVELEASSLGSLQSTSDESVVGSAEEEGWVSSSSLNP